MVYASHAATGNHAHSLSPCVPPPGVRCARCVKPYAQHPRSLCGDSLPRSPRRVPLARPLECTSVITVARELYWYRHSPGLAEREQSTPGVLISGHYSWYLPCVTHRRVSYSRICRVVGVATRLSTYRLPIILTLTRALDSLCDRSRAHAASPRSALHHEQMPGVCRRTRQASTASANSSLPSSCPPPGRLVD